MPPRHGKKKSSARRASPRKDSKTHPAELVIITGMSGSGKASVLKSFEDLGYYCVDNLPVDLVPQFADLVADSPEINRAALVLDIREGQGLDRLPATLRSVRQIVKSSVVFLEADDEI